MRGGALIPQPLLPATSGSYRGEGEADVKIGVAFASILICSSPRPRDPPVGFKLAVARNEPDEGSRRTDLYVCYIGLNVSVTRDVPFNVRLSVPAASVPVLSWYSVDAMGVGPVDTCSGRSHFTCPSATSQLAPSV